MWVVVGGGGGWWWVLKVTLVLALVQNQGLGLDLDQAEQYKMFTRKQKFKGEN